MAKLLKPLVVVLLLLSIVSLVLGIMLFSQREILKGRTQKLELAAAKVAENVRMENFNAAALKEFDRMDAPLNELATVADIQYEDLQNTKQDLDKTRQDLAQTQEQLGNTKAQLADAQSEIGDLRSEIETKDVELAQSRGRVEQLEQDKANLQLEVDDLNEKMVKAEEKERDLQDQFATLDNALKRCEEASGKMGAHALPTGLSGRILVVNPYWNFVVLDIGSEAGLGLSNEMLIHRGDKLVGRVRISEVTDNMAIADILGDWQQDEVQEGDHVLF